MIPTMRRADILSIGMLVVQVKHEVVVTLFILFIFFVIPHLPTRA